MRIGVLGLGHMGLPIARALYDRDHEVFSWSRKSSSYPWFHSISTETLSAKRLDFLLVASGYARPGLGDQISEINSTLDLIPKSLRYEETRILYLSSGAVYGECPYPKSEIDQVLPTTTYGSIKASVEKEFDQIFMDRFTSLRVGNIVDWENPYGILAMARKAQHCRSLDFFGNPDDCRDYVSIYELCLMISKVIESNKYEKVINLGSGFSISLREVSEAFMSSFPNLKINWNSPRIFDVSKTKLDIEKVRKLTSVEPTDPKPLFNDYLRGMI